MKALLDTHILVWWHADHDQLSREQLKVIEAADAQTPLQVADISLWEIATLHGLGRLRLSIPLREWLEMAVAPPLARCHGMTPAVAAELASFPESFRCDPADRILVATARVIGATLLTQDRRIAEAGLVDTLG